MNLHQIAAPYISAVNPFMPVRIQISNGAVTNPDGTQTPQYQTPGSFVGQINGTTLTIAVLSEGFPAVGQKLKDLTGVLLPETRITAFLNGVPGAWNWQVNQSQTVPSELMTTEMWLQAQVQPMTWKDLQQVDGLNVEGARWKIFLTGQVDGVIRPEKKGGDLIKITHGPHRGTWLVGQVLEQWRDWVSAAITLQNTDCD